MNDAEIAVLLAWAKEQAGPVRQAADRLADHLELQRGLPETNLWGQPLRDGPLMLKLIAGDVEYLKSKIAEARKS